MQRVAVWLYRAVGTGLAMALMEVLARFAGEPLARVPFVTSIVLVMAYPESEPARPYAVVAGHMLSCAAGVAGLLVLGAGDAASAVAVGLAALLMLAARALHPPAGIDAFLIAGQGLPLAWVASPVLVGAVLLVLFARAWSLGEAVLAGRLAARADPTGTFGGARR